MAYETPRVVPMTTEYARAISLWKYDGEYSFYDHHEGNVEGYMDGTHYACLNAQGEVIGYFCFGQDAQIPTVEENTYDDGFLDVGLGLRPDLCGRGYGLAFLNHGLDYAQRHFNENSFRLSVAVFNQRAVKVYKSAGFLIECEVTNSYFKNKFFIMKYMR